MSALSCASRVSAKGSHVALPAILRRDSIGLSVNPGPPRAQPGADAGRSTRGVAAIWLLNDIVGKTAAQPREAR